MIDIRAAVNQWIQTSLARQLFATFACYLCVMTGSLCFYWISPYSIQLTSNNNQVMTPSQIASIISVVEIGEAITCIPVAMLSDRYGRKTTLLSVGPLSAVLWIVTIFTKNTVVLYVVRLLQGLCISLVETVASVYIAEIASAKRRGTLGGYYAVFWNMAILYAYINADYMSFNIYVLTLITVPLLFFTCFILMPESPYYYLMVNNPKKARSALNWLRYGEQDIEIEFKEIEKSVYEDMSNTGSWKDLFATKNDRRAFFIVQIVCISRYMIGIGTFIAYAQDVFTKAEQHILTTNQQSICVALLFALSAFAASFFSDTVGRRKLLIYSLFGTIVCNIIIALYFALFELTTLQISPYVWLMYLSVIFYCIFANIGLVQLLPTVKAEFFPSHTRSKGGAITNLIAAIAIFVQLYTFPIITVYIGMYFNFVIFALIALIGVIFVTIYVPESAGKTLAEINKNIKEITTSA